MNNTVLENVTNFTKELVNDIIDENKLNDQLAIFKISDNEQIKFVREHAERSVLYFITCKMQENIQTEFKEKKHNNKRIPKNFKNNLYKKALMLGEKYGTCYHYVQIIPNCGVGDNYYTLEWCEKFQKGFNHYPPDVYMRVEETLLKENYEELIPLFLENSEEITKKDIITLKNILYLQIFKFDNANKLCVKCIEQFIKRKKYACDEDTYKYRVKKWKQLLNDTKRYKNKFERYLEELNIEYPENNT